MTGSSGTLSLTAQAEVEDAGVHASAGGDPKDREMDAI